MCASSTPRSRSRSDSHGPLRSATIPDSTSVPVTTMPARTLIRAGRPLGLGQRLRLAAGADLVADRRVVGDRVGLAVDPHHRLAGAERHRGSAWSGTSRCPGWPAASGCSISGSPAAFSRHTLTGPVGWICSRTTVGFAGACSFCFFFCLAVAAGGRRGGRRRRRRSTSSPGSSSPPGAEQVQRGDEQRRRRRRRPSTARAPAGAGARGAPPRFVPNGVELLRRPGARSASGTPRRGCARRARGSPRTCAGTS